MNPESMNATAPTDTRRDFRGVFDAICANVDAAVLGKSEVVRLGVTCLLANGHLLLEDVPGVGKTSFAKALARSLDTSFGRVQFTPDLLPSDVTGTTVWNQSDSSMTFRPGPVFSHLLLGDEINRASPKTQSSLLEAMEERQVTVDGHTYQLPRPFMVIATQNPHEHHGTFPLPESQLDRFLMRLSIGYPSAGAELDLLCEPDHDAVLDRLAAVATANDIEAMSHAATQVHLERSLAAYVVDLAERSRSSSTFALGLSPRAGLGLIRAAKVWAAADGRGFVTPDDLKHMAHPVLDHRLVVSHEARLRDITSSDALDDLLRTTPIPA